MAEKEVILHFSEPDRERFLALTSQLHKESDRGMVLISMSYIEEIMRRILLAFFIEGKISSSLVDGSNPPLGSLSTSSKAALALGLITEREFLECDTIRKIRNQFAHKIHVSFDDPSIRDSCANLAFAGTINGGAIMEPRGAFATASIGLILNLTNRAINVARQRRVYGDWPI